MKSKLIVILVGSLFFLGCANGGPKQTAGTYIGAATGALVGSQFGKGSGRLVGVALGTFLGGMLGSEIGSRMDAKDKELAAHAVNNSLENFPDNKVASWRNPNNNHSGNFVVTRTDEYHDQNKVCRDYVNTVIIDGEKEKVSGRACRDVRDPKAQWIIVNE
jgi:surface antigen